MQQWLVPEVLGPRGKYEELLLLQDTVDGKVVLARDWKTKERVCCSPVCILPFPQQA